MKLNEIFVNFREIFKIFDLDKGEFRLNNSQDYRCSATSKIAGGDRLDYRRVENLFG